MDRKNTNTFIGILNTHPEGVSHSELHNWWTGGGKKRPPAKEIREIAAQLHEDGTISITDIPSRRGRPARIYQLNIYKDTYEAKLPFAATRHEDKLERDLTDYLLGTGRTYRQICKKFGELDVHFVLDHAENFFPNLSLFKDINKDGEHSFILLPTPSRLPNVGARDWDYHIASDPESGEQQGYQMIQFPDSAFQPGGRYGNRITIVPLFDVHYGAKGCREDKFNEYIRWIKETPGMYAILGGDLMDNALDDGRGMMYDQIHNPQTQLDNLTKLLTPIAHQCLMMIPGNHENRTYKKTGIQPARILADRLYIPYHDGPVLLNCLAGDFKHRIHVQHGFSRPATKGGQLNAAQKPAKFMEADAYLSGHTHEAIVSEETVLREDTQTGSLRFTPRWTIVAQSFYGYWGTYGYRAGYSPVTGGGVVLELYENGEFVPSTR
jgi:hypothetical protein